MLLSKNSILHAILVFCLGCIGILLIQNLRKRIINTLKSVKYSEIVCIYGSQAESTEDMKKTLKNAHYLDVLAISGLGIIGLNDSALRRIVLSCGDKTIDIRLMLLNPESKYVTERASEIGNNVEAYKKGIEMGIAQAKALKESCPHNIHLYLYDKKPCWRVIRMDNNYYISVFDNKFEGRFANVYKIDGKNKGTLGRAFSRYIDSIIEDSIEIYS